VNLPSGGPSATRGTGSPGRGARSGSLWLAVAVGLAAFALALLVRISNLNEAFSQGVPQFPPADDLYHAVRIVHSALFFPDVLDFDSGRGIAGSWCPWPPLYDLLAGGAARLLGGTTPRGVLVRAAFFPPIVFSLFGGAAALVLTLRAGPLAGAVTGAALAFSHPLYVVSRIGAIDHHFLEPPLLCGVIAAICAATDVHRPVATRSLLLAGCLTAAIFVQTSLLLAAAVGLAALLLVSFDEGSTLACAALAFGVTAAAVGLRAATRPPAYPVNAWYLGAPHAAAFAGAGVTCLIAAVLMHRAPPVRRFSVALLGGAAATFAVPGSAAAVLEGARFFGGDPWLATIAEFRPILFVPGATPLRDLVLLGGGTLLVFPFALEACRQRRRHRLVLALFALVFLAASLSTRRFVVMAIPLLAVSGALVAADAAAWSRVLAAGAAVLTAGPALALAPLWLGLRIPLVPPDAAPMVRAAQHLRALPPGRGRLLGPWSWGHLYHVMGNQPVVLDNFGASIGRTAFEDAHAVLLLTRDSAVPRSLTRLGVRYVVLQNPMVAIRSFALCLDQPLDPWLRPETPGGGPVPTRLLRSTVWWRLYAGASPHGPAGAIPAGFRLLYADPAAAGAASPWDGSSVVVWEFTDFRTTPSGQREFR
jgi:asparagine N-glycosylation enzyme membrane subunit Stt3